MASRFLSSTRIAFARVAQPVARPSVVAKRFYDSPARSEQSSTASTDDIAHTEGAYDKDTDPSSEASQISGETGQQLKDEGKQGGYTGSAADSKASQVPETHPADDRGSGSKSSGSSGGPATNRSGYQ